MSPDQSPDAADSSTIGDGQPAEAKAEPEHPFTLAVDIGGTGLKASVLDASGAMVADRVRVPTTYPLPPDKLVSMLTRLVAPLPTAERASVGFPGMVRDGPRALGPPLLHQERAGQRRSTPIWPSSGPSSTWPPS